MVASWKTVTKQCLKTAIVILLPCVGAGAIYEDFSYMMPCTLKTAGIGLGSDITGFPMLVRLTESRHRHVFQTAQSNGSDIRFSTKAGASPLSFEIERWELGGADSAAEIWVRIDTVKAAADRVILMHWGNASAPAGSDAASVFAAGGGFRGVWHLGETGSGTVREDATANGNDLSPRAMKQSAKSAAMIGLADSLASARLVSRENPADASLRSIPGGLTISCWVFLPVIGETQTYFNMPGVFRLSNDGKAQNSGKDWFAGRARDWWKYSGTVKQASTWYHVAATYDASDSTLQYYLNGVPDGAHRFPATIGTVSGGQFIIGSATADHPDNCLNGVIDEVRVEAATRDAGWMKLCYLSQKRGADIVRYAPAETRQAGPPEILSHPQPVTAPVGTTARFSVTVMGNGVTYQWLKNGAPIVDAGSASYTTPTLTAENNGEIYECVVGNDHGTVTTHTALLTVTQPPPAVSGVLPLDTLVPLGGRAVFSVQASGAPPLQYTWFRVGDGVVGSGASLQIVPDSREAYHGSRYYCEVSNARGSARSDTVLLRVVGPLAAAFDVVPTKGQDSLRAVFTDRSTGSIKQWRWYFGDGDSARYGPADNSGSLTHVYRGVGEYVCTLVVVGDDQSGMDTAVSGKLFVYPPGNNDITLSARFLASDRLEVSFTGADRVNTNPVLGPAASQVGLWVNREGGEIDPATHPRVAVFELTAMQGASPYVAVVTVPPSLTALQRRYNLWASPLWDQGLSAYSARNAAEVVMKPLNALQLEGEFAGCPGTPDTIALNTDSLEWARVLVKATATVDTVGVGGIVLSYGYAGGDILRVDTIPAAGLGTLPYTWAVWNKGFFADTQQVVARAVQVARNGLTSDPVEARFYVGWPRPTNPAGAMRAQAALSSQVRLNWRWVGPTTGVDRVLLWQDTKPLPAGSTTPGAAFTPETLQVSDTTYLVEGLNKETRYYFALQVRKNLLWSPLTVEASANDSTPSFTNNDSVPNTVAIDTAWFETGSNGIRIAWRVDTIPGVRMEWGIRSGLSRAQLLVPFDPPRGREVQSVRETTLVMLEDMLFDTTYHVGIWLRGLDGPWSLPTDSSLCAVRSPSFTWEAVTYFTGGDTVFAFNNNVILRKGPGYGDAFPVEDTVDYFVPTGMPPGLIPASIGVSLRKGSYSDRQKFFVGIRYNPALPPGRTTAHLALFRPRGGTWEVEHESFARDGYVWVETSRFLDTGTPIPFVAMVDTVAPSISLPDTGRVADGGKGLSGSLSVRDNCGNVEWMVHYARDGEAFSEEKTFKGVLCGSCDSAAGASWTFPASHVTERVGVRAHLVVSDGVYRDTVNVSHRARRGNSDPVTTEKMEWVPVFATSRLEKPGVTEALSGLAGDDGVWDYDTRAFRLFRWVRTAANAGTSDDRWVEYSEENRALFTFEPGRLMWLKTRKRVPVGLGPGTTLSLKDPFAISLAAQEWTDMAVPFGFDVAVADVVGATGEAGRNLQFYRWERRETSEFGKTAVFFRTVPVYVAGIPSLDDPGAKLVSAPLRGHSIFNPAAADIVLRIPPLPAGVRAFGAGKRRGATGAEADVTQWSVRLPAKSGSGVPLNTVYCGYRQAGEGTTYYGFAPTFAEQSIKVRDPETGTLYGHAVHHETAGEGCAFLVAFCNDGPRAQTIVCRPEQAVRPPSGAVVRMVNPDGGAMKDSDGQWAVRVDAGRREDRFLLVGTEQYCASFGATSGRTPAKLVGCRFKRVGARVELRYTLPWSGVSMVRFEAFDLRGRALWSHASRPARGGRHVLVRDARAEGESTPGAGIYVVRMSVYDEAGGRMARFERRLDIIP